MTLDLPGTIRGAVQSLTTAIAEHAIAENPALTPVTIGTPVSRIDGLLKVTGAASYSSDIQVAGHGVRGHRAEHGGTRERSRTLTSVKRPACPVSSPSSRTKTRPGCGETWCRRSVWALVAGTRLPSPAGRPCAFCRTADGRRRRRNVRTGDRRGVAPAGLVRRAAGGNRPASGDPRGDVYTPKPRLGEVDYARGDPAQAFANAPVRLEQEYATPAQTNNPLGLFATVAAWDGDRSRSTTPTSTRKASPSRRRACSGFPAMTCSVMSPFVGGGFGAGLRAWPHPWLAAMAARVVGRPVKLVLSPRTDVHGRRTPRGDRFSM